MQQQSLPAEHWLPVAHQRHQYVGSDPCILLQGLASALTRGPVLPALHVVAAILLAALMGNFNTQMYLDLNNQ
jgi:hypothetical protein